MIEGIHADRTVAIVVGIERYGLGEGWDLDGVAQDAMKFAQWLLDRGVKNIRLYLSPLEKNKSACEEFGSRPGIKLRPATHDEIMDGLTQELNTSAELDGDLLFLFWSGHGLATSDRVRHLLFANATEINRTAVDFNSVMVMLRDPARRQFTYQVGIVDACANYQTEQLSPTTAPVSGLPPNGEVKQFVLFGSSVSEQAVHDKERRTSVFSSELLRRLEQIPHTIDRPWPNVNRLRDELKAHFDQMKSENKLSFTQTPAAFRWQWPDEDEGMAGVEMDAPSILRYLQARRVFDEIRMLENCPIEVMDEAYQLTLDPRQKVNYAARGIEEQIQELASLSPRKKGEALPLFEFVLRLERYSATLRKWIIRELEEARLPLSQLASLDQRFKQERTREARKPGTARHIVFDLGGEQIEYWHFRGDEFENGSESHGWLTDPKADPATQISNHLKWLESRGKPGESYFLEFLVRFDKPTDLQPHDEWEHGPFTLGQRYPVGVRWRDRTVGNNIAGQALWRAKTSAIKARQALDQAPPLRWLPDRRFSLARLPDKHEDDCIGFTAAPEQMWETLLTILNSGVPFAVWPRGMPHRQFKSKFGKELRAYCQSIDRLPELLKELRIHATEIKNHFCAAITLLWDDPARDPLNCGDDQLAQPDES